MIIANSRATSVAQSFPVLPAEFWQQLEIKHAAAMRDFGKLMKAFRELQNPPIKQAELAQALNITQGQVSRIESGRSAITDLTKLARWAIVIGVPFNLLWFDPPTHVTIPYTTDDDDVKIGSTTNEGDIVDRRQFLKAVTASPTLINSSDLPTTSHAVGVSDVARVHDWTENFRRMDNKWGGGHGINQAGYFLQNDVLPMLTESRMTNAVRKSLLVEAAQLFQLVGWMHYDTANQNAGRTALRNAFRLASDADDYALAAEMQAGLSHQASFLRIPDLAEDAASNAIHHARLSGLMSVRSEAAVMEANAFALQGDEKRTIRALATAEDFFCQIRSGDTPVWHRYYDQAYLNAKFGTVLRDLGDSERAEGYARASLNMTDGYERGRTFNLCLLAGVLADRGELEEALVHVNLAMQTATSIRSSRVREYLSDVGHRLARYANTPEVKEFYHNLSKKGIPTRRFA
ncbi:helix-turn-helix domain-containing protein [Kibdelosporangium aridum]|nr:helix-turn-helix transcriptional regulator [Kibdelosporangium aridum]